MSQFSESPSNVAAGCVLVDDATLYVQKFGGHPSAATIVFLHDALGCAELWRDFPQKLCAAAGLNGLLYDRQGHGRSAPMQVARDIHYLEKEGETLVKLLAAEQLERVVLFGHSDGGSIALVTAALAPDRVVAVVTEAAHVFVEPITLAGIEKACEHREMLISRLAKYHADKAATLFGAWSDVWRAPWYQAFNLEAYLPRINVPTLVIQGQEDEYGTERQVDTIVSATTGTAQKLMLAGVGHNPHRESEAAVIQATADFLARHGIH